MSAILFAESGTCSWPVSQALSLAFARFCVRLAANSCGTVGNSSCRSSVRSFIRFACLMADFWDEEIEAMLDALTSLIEPMLIVFLGVIVGGIVIAMFLPIFKLNEVVSQNKSN